MVQAKYRRVEVYEYQNREGEPVKQAMPGQFKWESTPGRWLLNVIYEFFTEPNDSLANEKCKDWYNYLHETLNAMLRQEMDERALAAQVQKHGPGHGREPPPKRGRHEKQAGQHEALLAQPGRLGARELLHQHPLFEPG